MNGIPHFDYSLAPFWPSYQNKIIGVLNRALREQSCSRVRRILLRLPWLCLKHIQFSKSLR
ncbi:hypothetical protein [Escherichia coli]|uniref:hypothetical protein n=1 Tax=Escherichia coli TaxID=562 RepID=UPI000A3639E3|nr:hypothetical protein [Escherichia coli]